MRLWARKQGFSLSESALVPRWGDPKKDFKGDPIPAASEYFNFVNTVLTLLIDDKFLNYLD